MLTFACLKKCDKGLSCSKLHEAAFTIKRSYDRDANYLAHPRTDELWKSISLSCHLQAIQRAINVLAQHGRAHADTMEGWESTCEMTHAGAWELFHLDIEVRKSLIKSTKEVDPNVYRSLFEISLTQLQPAEMVLYFTCTAECMPWHLLELPSTINAESVAIDSPLISKLDNQTFIRQLLDDIASPTYLSYLIDALSDQMCLIDDIYIAGMYAAQDEVYGRLQDLHVQLIGVHREALESNPTEDLAAQQTNAYSTEDDEPCIFVFE